MFDIKKLRTHLSCGLRLFIQLALSEITFIYPLKSQNSSIKYEYDDKIKDKIDEIVKKDFKREIVHNLISNGGRSDIKTIKKSSAGIYSDSDMLEEILLEVSTQQKDA